MVVFYDVIHNHAPLRVGRAASLESVAGADGEAKTWIDGPAGRVRIPAVSLPGSPSPNSVYADRGRVVKANIPCYLGGGRRGFDPRQL